MLILRAIICAAFAAVLTASGAALAWPTKPIRIVVPFPPGGPTDLIARLVAQKLGDVIGQPGVIDNRSGASSVIGSELVARAAPDGYTFLVNPSIHTINASVAKNLPYDTVRDFAPVTLLASVPLVLVANPTLPAKTLPELIALAKARPGALSYASPGAGGGSHLALEMLKMMASIDLVHIPYRGSGPALTDLVSGQVAVMFDGLPTAMSLVREGKLVALAVSTKARSPAEPQLPTVAEGGLPDYDLSTWYGMFAPARTEAAILERMSDAVRQILQQPDVAERLRGMGATAGGNPPEAFAAFVNTEIGRWAELVQRTGLRVDQ